MPTVAPPSLKDSDKSILIVDDEESVRGVFYSYMSAIPVLLRLLGRRGDSATPNRVFRAGSDGRTQARVERGRVIA